MSELTIEKDIEFIKNQVNYLDSFQKKITKALAELQTFSVYWKGVGEEERSYVEIDRWLKCYTQLKDHLSNKDVIDTSLKAELNLLPSLIFEKPMNSQDEIKTKSGGVKFLYAAFPPFRIRFNKKKVKGIKKQIAEYKNWVDKLRKLSYKIESLYTDGI